MKSDKSATTRTVSIAAILLLSVSTSTVTLAEDDIAATLAHGEKLHEQHCLKCHTDEVYTREDRLVKSIDALNKQVKRCKNNLGMQWFDDDTEAVAQFLNNEYYKF